MAREDCSTPEEWIFDQTLHTDTETWYVCQIGHDIAHEDSTNLRFITDQ